MARPVTIFTGQWADLPMEEMCRTAKEMGYEGLEIASWGQIDVEKAAEDLNYVKELKGKLEEYGLGCWAIGMHLPGQCVGDAETWAYGQAGGDPGLGRPSDGVRRQGGPEHGSEGGHLLHGLPHLEDVVLLPPDLPGAGGCGLSAHQGAVVPDYGRV